MGFGAILVMISTAIPLAAKLYQYGGEKNLFGNPPRIAPKIARVNRPLDGPSVYIISTFTWVLRGLHSFCDLCVSIFPLPRLKYQNFHDQLTVGLVAQSVRAPVIWSGGRELKSHRGQRFFVWSRILVSFAGLVSPGDSGNFFLALFKTL